MDYDEPKVLTEYVWSQCRDQFTDLEFKIWQADIARQKARASMDPRIRRMMSKRFEFDSDPKLVEVLSGELEEFRVKVRDRIAREHPEIINRCPKCNRIARTPRAKQCRWCFFDWHESS